MKENREISKVLEMIKTGKLSTAEGMELIKYYRKNNASSHPAAAPSKKDVEVLVKKIISECTKIPAEHIISEEPLESIGIDSIMIKTLNKSFKEYFPSLSATVFFECHTLDELIVYLTEKHQEELSHIWSGPSQNSSSTTHRDKLNKDMDITTDNLTGVIAPPIVTPKEEKYMKEDTEEDGISRDFEKIAIIGMDGRFPESENLPEFWNNLTEGKDCITEVPKERWDWEKYYGAGKEDGNVYCKWGGFLKDVDKFDPLFFHISPKEANFMDPHERIFLETAWHAIEDAGYTREELKESKVGVFASAMYGHYELFGVEETSKGAPLATSSLFSNIPNRVSYIMNFRGPSLFVETACSSSLEVLRLACDSIQNKECDMAIVGGVNLSLHENKYILLCQTNFLASDGRCRSFGEGGDGYVPGEACGVVVVKSLERAQKDGDHIYGVIDGIATNHGGKTNGYSVPNPKAQTELIQNVIELSQVPPESIGYIEAHGTGTALGDPIEITALNNAFHKYTDKKQFIRIGSVKSNIGHCEAASGMASIIKVLLMFQKKKLVPSLHSAIPNKEIAFEKTPFALQHRYEDWNTTSGMARRAGISAFGAGGTNLHAILEEYEDTLEAHREVNTDKNRLFVLSAKNQQALTRYAKAVIDFLKKEETMQNKNTLFADLVYTFQLGREELEHRLCIIASGTEELKNKLEAFLEQKEDKDILTGIVKKIKEQESITIKEKDLWEAAQFWVNGSRILWKEAYTLERPRKISAPNYPFDKERCWIKSRSNKEEVKAAEPVLDKASGKKQAIEYLKEVFGAELEIAADRIDSEQTFDRYGLDSVMVVNLTKTLEKRLGEISKTIFFEYDTLDHLADYFINGFPQEFCEKKEVIAAEDSRKQVSETDFITSDDRITYETSEVYDKEYAIIGISGRYPMAEDLNQFWDNLLEGRDCITNVPKERWDYHRFDNLPYEISKWGGFIDDVNKFDPLFFQISPAEAELIDPQERLFLETSWAAMEDAGYTLENFNKHRTGVFVGVTYGQYQMIGVEETLKGNTMAMNSAFSAIANRVSYCMNLHGPSFAVDTMCSSSLTALHLAMQSLSRGECDTAIAGGVNLSIHWSKYLLLGMNHFTSSDGRCRAFGDAGDGYVPGEGVGAVIIKPLSAAIKDGDYIYGVIKGSTINHGGKTNGYTVPNPNAQAEVIQKAIENAGVHPETISYLEAHGTGTSLGDPIEIAGLTKAFGKYTEQKQYCSIGSVKSNIGHLEAASGVAGLTKILLQFKHNRLVPSIHSEVLNNKINFAATPFHVQRKQEAWKQNHRENKAAMEAIPKRAAISAFGAGGSNAHVILEAYENEPSKETPGEKVYVFSAKKEENLKAYVIKFMDYLREDKNTGNNLAKIIEDLFELPENCVNQTDTLSDCGLDEVMIQKLKDYLWNEREIALTDQEISQGSSVKALEEKLFGSRTLPLTAISYTLQTGRESMKERLAVIALNAEDLWEKLKAYLDGNITGDKIYVKGKGETKLSSILSKEEISQMVHKSFQTNNLVQLSKYWVNGIEINWEELYSSGSKPKRIPLPTYAFSKVEYTVKRSNAILENYKLDEETSIPILESTIPKSAIPEQVIPESPIQELQEEESHPYNSGETAEEFTKNQVRKTLSEIIKLTVSEIEDEEQIGNYGFDSIKLGELCNALNRIYHTDLEPTLLFSYNTVEKITDYLLTNYEKSVKEVYAVADRKPAPIRISSTKAAKENNNGTSLTGNEEYHDIAIIGMDARLPMAGDLGEFWVNLSKGRDCISEVPKSRYDVDKYYSVNQRNKNMTNSKWGGFIEDVDKFDAKFFNISPFEAELMDPQQRLTLEVVWRTIENAGYRPSALSGENVGVFMTSQLSEYPALLVKGPADIEAQTVTGSMEAMMANRVSYYYNLTGPSEVVNTACSASMAALNRAVKSLRAGECDMALVGGACLALTPESFITQTKLGVLSPEGKCKTFDADADGFVKGEGVGAVLLKPAKKALIEKDNIIGIIKGIAENHGGKANSLTAPNTDAQAEVISRAVLDAKIPADTLTYIETHGTGTRLGDSVEIEGLKAAFKKLENTASRAEGLTGYCGIGSVKTNIGHLEPMSGMAGLFKVLLSMKHQVLPRTIHLKNQNPFIHLENSPFYIVKENRQWNTLKDMEGNPIPRRAGVSSFGIGGSNVSVILEEPSSSEAEKENNNRSTQILCISAKSQPSLRKVIQKLAVFVSLRGDKLNLENLAYTLISAREEFGHRTAFIADNAETLLETIESFLEQGENGESSFQGEAVKNRSNKIYTLEEMKEAPGVLARAWVQGERVPFKEYMEKNSAQRKIVIPGYEFDRERYWIDRKESANTYGLTVAPLLSENMSTLEQAVFRTVITGEEKYLSLDEKADQIIPGTILIEMVLEALKAAMPKEKACIKSAIIYRSIKAGNQITEIYTILKKQSENEVRWEITGSENEVYAKGLAVFSMPEAEQIIDPAIFKKWQEVTLPPSKLLKGDKTALQPELLNRCFDMLFCSLSDIALNKTIGQLPFFIGKLTVYKKAEGRLRAGFLNTQIEKRENYLQIQTDLIVADSEGGIIFQMSGLNFRIVYSWINTEDSGREESYFEVLQKLSEGKMRVYEAVNSL